MAAFRAIFLLILLQQLSCSRISKRDTTPVQIEANKAVKVFHQTQWGYICANKWDSNDAKVICRMQGFWHGSGVASVISIPNNVYLLDNVVCTGSEGDISDCHYTGWTVPDCPLRAVAGADCSNGATANLRLSGGFVPWEGRVEVLSEGSWRPICGDQWDDKDATVVCRSLGMSLSKGTAIINTKYGHSSAAPIISETVCLGHETDLALCKASEVIKNPNCTQAGVECYNCGDEYRTVTGTIQSANFPGPYAGYQHCLYVIRPPNNGELYKLEFPVFKTEKCCDTLQVTLLQNTTNYPEGGRIYSGDNVPPTMLGKAFAVMFNTDGSNSFQGFQAKWSPARVEDLVDITCGSGSFNITIDLITLKRLYPQSSERSIGLADPTCVGSMAADDKLVISAETDSCGTRVTSTQSSQIYTNFLVDRVFASSNNMIVRQERWKIPIRCEVPRNQDFLLHYNPYANSRRSSVKSHSRRVVKGHIQSIQPFPVQMEVFSDKDMTTRLYGTVTRHLGDNLFLRADLPQGDSDLTLVLNDCFARPSPSDTGKTYYLIRDGCEVDSQTHILRREAHHTDIQIVVFEFAGDYPQVYITCDVRICPNTDHSAQCDQACATNPRRSENTDSVVSPFSVTFGPIHLVQ